MPPSKQKFKKEKMLTGTDATALQKINFSFGIRFTHFYGSCQFFFTCRFVIPTGKTEMTVTESLGRVSDVIYWANLYKRNTIALMILTDNIMKDKLGGNPKRPQRFQSH
jgi:hypothetical protein